MVAITVHRIFPASDSTFSSDMEVPLRQLPQTWSWSNITGMLPTSLSGEKGDYNWNYDIPTATLSISSKLSYQQRFYAKQAEMTDRIAALEDELAKRNQADEYFREVIMKVQIYTSLGRSASLKIIQVEWLTFIQSSLTIGSGSFLAMSGKDYQMLDYLIVRRHCLCLVYLLMTLVDSAKMLCSMVVLLVRCRPCAVYDACNRFGFISTLCPRCR